jgi:WD40 repeat protein
MKLWDVSSGAEIRTFKKDDKKHIYSVAFSPDGSYALSGSTDKTMKLWDVDSGAEIRTFKGHTLDVLSVVFSPDGRYALSGSYDKTMKLWDVSSGAEIRTFKGHSNNINSVTFSPDGRYALSGSGYFANDNVMKLWDVSSGAEIRTFKKQHLEGVHSVAFSPGGRYALSGSVDEAMTLWDVSSGDEIRTMDHYPHHINSIAISRDGRYALSGSIDKTMKLWEVSSGAEIRTFKGHSESVSSVALSPDGRYALSGSIDQTMKLWNVSSGAEIRTFKGHRYNVYSYPVTFSQDGRYALSGGNNMKLWDVSSGAEISSFKGHTSSVYSVAFSPDGRYVISGSGDNSMKLWKVSSGAEIRTFKGHTQSVRSVVFSPDGSYIISGSFDNTMKLWDVSSGAIIRTFKNNTCGPSHGYTSRCSISMALSPDGRYIIFGYGNEIIELFNVSSGAIIRTFKGHTGSVNSVAFSPDGGYVYSGSWDRTLKVWDSGLQVVNQPPQASFSMNPNTGFAPLTVQLDASASTDNGSIAQYKWTSSDGQNAEGVKTSLTFSKVGTYNITLTVTDNEGATATKTQTITTLEPVTYKLNISTLPSGNGGSISGSTKENYNSGETVNLTATPEQCYAFTGWSGDCNGSSTCQLTMDSDKSVNANFEIQSFQLNISSDNGNVERQPNKTLYNCGETVKLTAKPNQAYKFKAWNGDANGSDESITINMNANKNITAIFQPVTSKPTTNTNEKYAIIIAASGAHKQNTLFTYSNALALRMYRTLFSRGYKHENIIYMNPDKWQDLHGSGRDAKIVDYELFQPQQELEKAFNTAANATKQFIFYIHGHAQKDNLQINREYWLPANQLQQQLNKIPAEQIIIIDTCYSGSFINEISGTKRTILTSSDAESVAWNNSNFSDTLIPALRRGKDINTAFLEAVAEIESKQIPQLDDDGDGIYSSRDGNHAAKQYINQQGVSQADAPQIIQIHDYISLPAEQARAVLWIKTSPSGEAIKKARATLIPPSLQNIEYQGEQTNFGRTQIEMLYNQAQDRYETVYKDFRQPGEWKIKYQIQGNQGFWSDTVTGIVQAAGVSTPVTIQISFNLSPVDARQTYQSELNLSGEQNFSIPQFEIPTGWKKGKYLGCGVIMTAKGDPWQSTNWISFECKEFSLR